MLGSRLGMGSNAGGCCCGGTPPIACGACSIPTTLHLTDSFTTFPIVYQPATSIWLGCYLLPVASGLSPCQCQGQAGAAAPGDTPIVYQVTFAPGGGGCEVNVTRNWVPCGGSAPGLPCGYCTGSTLNASCIASTQTCPPPFRNEACSGGVLDSYGPTPSTCPPGIFPLSLTLTLSSYINSNCPGGVVNSPLGTGVVIDV
jgi:hypothetical protein